MLLLEPFRAPHAAGLKQTTKKGYSAYTVPTRLCTAEHPVAFSHTPLHSACSKQCSIFEARDPPQAWLPSRLLTDFCSLWECWVLDPPLQSLSADDLSQVYGNSRPSWFTRGPTWWLFLSILIPLGSPEWLFPLGHKSWAPGFLQPCPILPNSKPVWLRPSSPACFVPNFPWP